MERVLGKNSNSPKNSGILNLIGRRFFLSALILNIGSAIISFVDGLVVAKFLDSTSLAAYGLASSVFGIVLFVESVLEVGVKLQVTEAYGKGNMKRISELFTISISAVIVLSTLFALSGLLFSRKIAVILGANQELLEGTASYIRGLSIGFPFMMAISICFVFFFMSGAYKYLKVLGLASVALSVLLDIFVGIVRPSLFGFAFATSLGYILSGIAVLVCLFKCSQIKLWNGFSFKRLSLLGEIVREGRSVIIKKCCSMLRPILMNLIIVTVGGTMAAAAFSVRSGVNFLLSSISLSLGSALMMTVRYLYVCQDKEGIKYSLRTLLRSYFVISIVISAALYFSAPLIAGIYGYTSGDLHEKTVLLLRCTSVELLFYGYVSVYVMYMNAIRRQRLAIFFTLLNNLLSLMVSSWILIQIFGGEGLWYVYPFAAAFSCLILTAVRIADYCKSGKTEDSRYFLNSWDGAKDEDVLALMLTDSKQLPDALDELTDYCRRIGLSKKAEFRSRLAIEELSTNFFEHGVSGKEGKFFYAHFAFLDGKLYISVNDNCRHFSLVKYMNQVNSDNDDPAKGIGIKLIAHASDTIDYSSSFDMNCLNITINNAQ